ncbi:MAG: LamG-like jellyroll fold domain-containing protein [Parcubacteria group bacterium]
MKKKFKNQGSALIVSILILMLIVTITLTVTLVSIQNQTASNGEYRSSQSFQVADTGIEDLMYKLTKAGYAEVNQLPDCQSSGPLMGWIKSGNYAIRLQGPSGTAISCNGSDPTSSVVSIKSVSSLSNQSRAVEADVICRTPFKTDVDTVALYHFQEDGNSILDSSGMNNIGSVHGSLPPVAGFCNARSFDGNSSDYISVPDNNPNPSFSRLKITGQMTVSAWVKIGNGVITNWQRIIGKGTTAKRNYDLGVSTNGWEFQFNNGAGVTCDVSDSGSMDNSWHFVAGVYDGSKITLYVDGNKVDENSCSITQATDMSELTMGASSGIAPSEAFSGSMDEVSVIKKARSGSDIKAEFDKGAIFNLP